MPLMSSDSTQPSTPPHNESSTDSIMNESMIANGLKPSTSSVAISRVRAPTAAYMVFMAPNTAPTAMMRVMNTPAKRITFASSLGLVGVVVALALELDAEPRVGFSSSFLSAANFAGSFMRNVTLWNTSPRNTGISTALSPQISDSKPLPPAVKCPTTVKSLLLESQLVADTAVGEARARCAGRR